MTKKMTVLWGFFDHFW